VVLLEMKKAYWELKDGRSRNMGKQIFSYTSSLWYDSKPRQPEKDLKKINEERHACFVYREWELPQ
jgi:hypothetical protein